MASQSRQLNDAVMNGGAGDQGIVYGYAINNQYNFLPYGAYISNLIAKEIDTYRKSVDYLLPDGKVQVTISENNIEQLIINIQHKENIRPDFIEDDIKQKVLTQLIDCKNVDIQINRKSRFYRGGFINDTGLTGRKIMTDTYGGLVTHGGGAFPGKDPSKIDRSAAYMLDLLQKTSCKRIRKRMQNSSGLFVWSRTAYHAKSFNRQRIQFYKIEINHSIKIRF